MTGHDVAPPPAGAPSVAAEALTDTAALRRRVRAVEEELARTRALTSLTMRLAYARVPGDVVDVLAAEAPTALGASLSDVSLLDPRTRTMHLVAATGTPSDVAEEFATYPLDAPLPTRDALSERRPVLMRSIRERDELYPALASVTVAERAFAILPLVHGDVALGSVGFGWSEEQSFPPAELETMQLIADLCAAALERTRLYQAEHDIAEELQRALLPGTLPQLPWLDLAVRYRPSGLTAQVGGDWYDAFELPRGRFAVVIGDVSGHGVTAAARMGQLRQSLRDRSRPGSQPCTVMRRLNRTAMELGSDDLLATCCYLTIDPDQGRITWANAGHPPPVLSSSATTTLLGGTGQPPLAVVANTPYRQKGKAIGPSTRLVLYTDGLIERRDVRLEDSLALLQSAVRDGPESAADLCDHLMDTFAVSEAEDDVTVIVADLRAVAG